MTNPLFQILLYYKYVPIADPEGFHRSHRELCERLGLRGRILIGEEGINGTVSGAKAATEEYMEVVYADERFSDMVFKVDPHDGHAFPKLSIKVRSEIVSLHLRNEDFSPEETTGKRLSPEEWKAAMEEDGVVILDGRNDYESDLGRFKGAICPPVQNFRDFPDWIRQNLAGQKDKKILTYCTGGIRCEKLSGFLLREGFTDVSQLEGGIVTYGKDPVTTGKDFDGKCFVFDERIVVEVNRTDTAKTVSRCRVCGKPSERYVNCRNKACNLKIFLCEACESERGRFCGSECRAAVVEKAGVG
ncbi:MAG: rhodanese-related sulfurtransferase [Verrucomicrobiota bacterium]